MATPNSSRQEIEARLIEQANQNPSFRQRLLDDPKAAVAEMLGIALPPGMSITVLEEQPGQHYLVLPPARPAVDALPLDDLELALVGGGRTLRPQCGGPTPPDAPPPLRGGSRSAQSIQRSGSC